VPVPSSTRLLVILRSAATKNLAPNTNGAQSRARPGWVAQEASPDTNRTFEGRATAPYFTTLLGDTGVRITRLARGPAPGTQIEYGNRYMLEEALRGRREV